MSQTLISNFKRVYNPFFVDSFSGQLKNSNHSLSYISKRKGIREFPKKKMTPINLKSDFFEIFRKNAWKMKLGKVKTFGGVKTNGSGLNGVGVSNQIRLK